MDLSQKLLHLEQRLLSRATRRDAEEISCLIADDFVEFGASGGVWNKVELVEQLPFQPFSLRTISDFTAKQLSENAALVTYQCHTVAIDQRSPANSLRSSIWRKQGEQWQMVFHQGTFLPLR
ncbi:hypothetical protein DFS28_106251 [Pseudomonas sp. 478]|jgi:hypothetical protein|uniref:nuclear transport factor 2 family protein n=1 Tax=unclassified Pseudomonas TaxID=196821 RepID=UPI000DADFBD3|nr:MULTISPECIES: DUF4440 domain-containing protein [unclassified Pseudomonas]PZW96354.1 hypothetical protein DFS28_106251 [Pseudomonas sp. 478]TCV40564.1 hypothetical protein EDB99_13035 [Pseudomonas sp. 460]